MIPFEDSNSRTEFRTERALIFIEELMKERERESNIRMLSSLIDRAIEDHVRRFHGQQQYYKKSHPIDKSPVLLEDKKDKTETTPKTM